MSLVESAGAAGGSADTTGVGHYDGVYRGIDGQLSMLTLHAYLGEYGEGVVGGSTSFFGGRYNREIIADVEPVQGRILVFQHYALPHSGEEMQKGLKYTMRTDIMYERLPEEEDPNGPMPMDWVN